MWAEIKTTKNNSAFTAVTHKIKLIDTQVKEKAMVTADWNPGRYQVNDNIQVSVSRAGLPK